MKRIIPFSRYFVPAMICSGVLIATGLVGYVIKGGFNLGVDFQAGLLQEIQFAPTAFRISYDGRGNATISFNRNNLYIVISGSGLEGVTHEFPFNTFGTLDSLIAGLSNIEGLHATGVAPGTTPSRLLVQSAQGNPQLGADPFVVHYLPLDAEPIAIADVRETLLPLGTVSVQVLGTSAERRFMIRIEDQEIQGSEGVSAEKILTTLEARFGTGGVAITRADYVGSRFSKQLTDQAGLLMALTLLLIMVYASLRFNLQLAIGAVLAIAHDALIIVAFVTWTRMEFNTTTIAALLTILGYSINDTIVIFDRIRETLRIYPEAPFEDVLNRALTETLSRTIITTVTTMLAVLSLFIFTTGSMKDFALALLVGMISGVYSTVFIASGFVNLWAIHEKKRAKKKLIGVPVASKA